MKVLNRCTHDPIEGVEVLVIVSGNKVKKKTDASGIADIGEVPPGEYVVKLKMHFEDADHFLFLVHYPRITWKRKAIVESVAAATVPDGGEVEAPAELKVYRVVASIKFKRKDIDLFGEDKYGHWWSELGGGESYGWWPSKGVGIIDTVFGVPGALNGVPVFAGGTATSDPHDGDVAEQTFSPVIDDCRTDDELKDEVRAVANGYSGNWSWFFELGNHCHTFQKKIMGALRVAGYRDG